MSSARHEQVLEARVRWLLRARPPQIDPVFQMTGAAELAVRQFFLRSPASAGETIEAFAEIEECGRCAGFRDEAVRQGRLFPDPFTSHVWITENFQFFRFRELNAIPIVLGFMEQAPGEYIKQALGRREMYSQDSG